MSLLTIVFTDVVGSSRAKRDLSLGRDSRERDSNYLAQIQLPHFVVVRECCQKHGGREVKTIGDAFYLVFEDPTEAVRCCIAVQQRLTNEVIQTPHGQLQLRIGVHTGSPQRFEDDWHGTDVDIAARIEATAYGGQILISSATHELVRDMSDVQFHSLGEISLKGIDRVVLWQVDWDGRGPMPILGSPVSYDLDVPPSFDGFVGRTRELSQIESLLESHQAVSVEGFSGIGKTSFVLKLAENWLRSGRIVTDGLFYFDCSQHSVKLNVASEILLRNLSSFLLKNGGGESAELIASEHQSLNSRLNALSSSIASASLFLFLDNFQDALDENRRIADQGLARLLTFLLSRDLGNSRLLCASYIQCSWPSLASVHTFHLRQLSPGDAIALLLRLGIETRVLADQVSEIVGRHPQALRWFSVLPRKLALSIEEIISDISQRIHREVTEEAFRQRLESELLRRIWDTLPEGAGRFLSLMTVYRRPVPFAAFSALVDSPQVDRWRQVLIESFLIDSISRGGPHSLHALVREFAASQIPLGNDDWRDAHHAAASWWASQTSAPMRLTSEEIEAATEQHYHLLSAGELDEAESLAKMLRPRLRAAGFKSYRQGLRQETIVLNRAWLQTAPDNPMAHLYLAKVLAGTGAKYAKEAELCFKRAIELDPQFDAARNKYGAFLASRGLVLEAEKQLQLVITNNPKSARNHIAYANFLASTGRDPEAEEHFITAVNSSSTDPGCHLAYAKFLTTRGYHSKAESEFQAALTSDPKSSLVRHHYADFLKSQERLAEAEVELLKALELDPHSLVVCRAYIQLLFSQNRVDEAVGQFEVFIKAGVKINRLKDMFLKGLAKQDRPTLADTRLREAVEDDRNRVAPRKIYIKYLIRTERFQDAEQQFRLAISELDEKLTFRGLYANFLERYGRKREAEEQFEAAIKERPENSGIQLKYIKFLTRQRRFEEAEKLVKEALRYKPGDNQFKYLASMIAQRKPYPLRYTYKRPYQASDPRNMMWDRSRSDLDRINICKALLEEDTNDFEVNYCLGRILLLGSRDASVAEPYLRKAKELCPHDWKAQLLYGEAIEKLNRWSDALVIFDALTTTIGNDAELHNSRGNCLKALKKWSEAEQAYREAVRTSKLHRRAKFLNNLALLFTVWPDSSRIDEGLKICQELDDRYPAYQWTRQTRIALKQRLHENVGSIDQGTASDRPDDSKSPECSHRPPT